jgi:pimeloyl-ACP methyl ester carboxylesterase
MMLQSVLGIEEIRLFILTLLWYTMIAVASVSIFAGLALGATVAQAICVWSRKPWKSVRQLSSNKETLRHLVAEGLNTLECFEEKENLKVEILQGQVIVQPFSEIETYVVKVSSTTTTTNTPEIPSPPTLKQPLLLIHGINTGPLYFRTILRRLLADRERTMEIYLLALPGFGLVDVPQEVVRSFSSGEILDFYSNYLCKVVEHIFVQNIKTTFKKPIVVGHSFGAYLAASFYTRHPDLLEQVIFVNGIGLFPFVGSHGKHWSIFFKMGLPLFFTRPFGRFLHPLLSLVVDWIITHSPEKEASKAIWMFSAMLLTCPTNVSDLICSRFIDDYFIGSCWNLPIGGDLLCKGLRISFVWGVDDPIISRYLAQLMVDCSRFTEPTPFRLVEVLGGGHDPIVWNNGEDFVQAIRQLIDSSSSSEIAIATEAKPHATIVMTLLQDILNVQNTGVFCVSTTNKRIQQSCKKLTSKVWFQSNEPTITAIDPKE